MLLMAKIPESLHCFSHWAKWSIIRERKFIESKSFVANLQIGSSLIDNSRKSSETQILFSKWMEIYCKFHYVWSSKLREQECPDFKLNLFFQNLERRLNFQEIKTICFFFWQVSQFLKGGFLYFLKFYLLPPVSLHYTVIQFSLGNILLSTLWKFYVLTDIKNIFSLNLIINGSFLLIGQFLSSSCYCYVWNVIHF